MAHFLSFPSSLSICWLQRDFRSKPEEGPGAWYLHPSVAHLGEVVRELRRFSLATFDEDLPSLGDAPIIDADRTISLNSIVQELICAQIDVASRCL